MDPILGSPVDVGDGGVVLAEAPAGLPVIALPSALTGLHYFDGQAMRDARLTAEQTYRRALAALAARADGYGVAYGLDVAHTTSDLLRIGAGLAVDGAGRVLQLPSTRTISMADLIAASQATRWAFEETSSTSPEFLRCIRLWTARPVSARAAVMLWVVTASWTEQRVSWGGSGGGGSIVRDGIQLRAVPLSPRTPVARSRAIALDARLHLRSLIAGSVFADEWSHGGSLISAEGLGLDAWCLGAQWDTRRDVPLAVVAYAGNEILFVDEWLVRRERHEAPPSRYWAGLMRMRPWSAYIAQILQFQCQLSDAGVRGGVLDSPGCDDVRAAIAGAATYVSAVYQLWQAPPVAARFGQTPEQRAEAQVLLQVGGATRLEGVTRDIVDANVTAHRVFADQLLIRHGVVELPPAGYLPVSIGALPTVNDQVRALMGGGVDLRFCIVHPDVVAHELEKGQHMERISLLSGLDDPAKRPAVDIFVPDGVATSLAAPTDLYEASVRMAAASVRGGLFRGTGRRETLASDGTAVYLAATGVVAQFVGQAIHELAAGAAVEVAPSANANASAVWITARTDQVIRNLRATERAHVWGRAVLASTGDSTTGFELTFDGELVVHSSRKSSRGARLVSAVVVGRLSAIERQAGGDGDTAILASLRLSLDVEMRWHGTAHGEMTAKIFAHDTFGTLRERIRPHPIATVRKEWGVPVGRTTVTVRTPFALLDALQADVASPPAAAMEMLAQRGDQFATIELVENADVARVDHPLHVLANAAVGNVQALLDTETTFARDAELALFPPPPPPELVVQATRDWVLFRRRRDRRCYAWRDPATVGVRRFRLLSVTSVGKELPRNIASSLQTPGTMLSGALLQAIENAKSAPAILVEFPRDGAVPLDDPDELRAAWTSLRPGQSIGAGVIVSAGPEGPELLVRRLRALTPMLAPDSRVAVDAPMIALPTAVGGLATLDADGVILLVTS